MDYSSTSIVKSIENNECDVEFDISKVNKECGVVFDISKVKKEFSVENVNSNVNKESGIESNISKVNNESDIEFDISKVKKESCVESVASKAKMINAIDIDSEKYNEKLKSYQKNKKVKKYNLNILYYDEHLKNNEENSDNCSFIDMNTNGTFYGCHNFDLFKIVCEKIIKNKKEFILLSSGSAAKKVFDYCSYI